MKRRRERGGRWCRRKVGLGGGRAEVKSVVDRVGEGSRWWTMSMVERRVSGQAGN